MFRISVDLLNGAGMAVTMVGAAIYSKAELDHKKRQQQTAYKPINQESR